MVSFLIAISFILHLLAFFWILLLSIRIKRSKEIETRQVELQKEIEDMFQSYLLEIKEENEKILNIIEKKGNNNKVQLANTSQFESVPRFESNKKEDEATYKPSLLLQGKRAQQVYQSQKTLLQEHPQQEKTDDFVPPLPVSEERLEQSLTTQVIRLYEQGFDPNEIARKLSKGRTEIELMLKFREQTK